MRVAKEQRKLRLPNAFLSTKLNKWMALGLENGQRLMSQFKTSYIKGSEGEEFEQRLFLEATQDFSSSVKTRASGV